MALPAGRCHGSRPGPDKLGRGADERRRDGRDPKRGRGDVVGGPGELLLAPGELLCVRRLCRGELARPLHLLVACRHELLLELCQALARDARERADLGAGVAEETASVAAEVAGHLACLADDP